MILTAVALVVGEYLIVSYVLASADGHIVTGLPIAAPEDVAAALPGLIRDAPLRPVLWLIALGTAFIIPWRGLVGE